MDYKPTTTIENAYVRATLYQRIRDFFSSKNVLEVDTPILSHAGATDVHLQSVRAVFHQFGQSHLGYLHTSPEFAMKRLVATWQTPIYQIAKVFRDNEMGKRHNIEFSMLEWYQPNYSLEMLANELNELLNHVFKKNMLFSHISYQQAFLDYADIDPFTATIQDLEQVALFHGMDTSLLVESDFVSVMADDYLKDKLKKSETEDVNNYQQINESTQVSDDHTYNHFGYTITSFKKQNIELLQSHKEENLKASWLDFLFTSLVEPNLGKQMPTLIYDFPASQASLAKVTQNSAGHDVGKRFELYINGLEVANAYDEVCDRQTLQQRFDDDNHARKAQGIPQVAVDHHLLDAMQDMPSCAGIAVGIDRLLMLLCESADIAEVINFKTDNS